MDLPENPTSNFIYGKLTLNSEVGNITYQASSGVPNWQFLGAWKYPRRGCLPPSDRIGAHYHVETNRLYLPKVKGVEGSFWCIKPFSVRADGVMRSDLGVHFDANVLGSAGCIVLSGKHKQEHFDSFKEAMRKLNRLGVYKIPLEVIY